MELKNDALQARIVVPDHPTVRQVLAYDAELSVNTERSWYERLWDAGKKLTTELESPAISMETSLDDPASTQVVDTLKWAGLAIFTFRSELEDLPKNS
jgi:hypothetical protein